MKWKIKSASYQFKSTISLDYFILAIFILIFGLGSFIKAQSTTQTKSVEESGNYKIGVGDVLKVLVLKQDILSQDNLRVGNDGTIRMPMLDTAIPAACLTEDELSSELTKRYKKYILNPQVYVSVKEFNANPIAVGGAVTTPGIFQLKRPMRLLEVLSFVSGPSANAGPTVQIMRSLDSNRCAQLSLERTENPVTDESSSEEIITLPLTEVMKGNARANPFLQGGDIIRVPEAEIKQAFIIGNVKSAVIINLKEPVTLTKAIAMAGGIAPGANIEKVKISRQIPDSLAKNIVIVNLKEINKLNQEDVLLQPDDIVEIPSDTGIGKTLKDIFRSVAPAITRGVPVYIP